METIKLSPRKIANDTKRQIAVEESIRNQKPVKELTITIEWSRSRMWGNNPKASAEGVYHDGTYFHSDKPATASGCGYDKESTVIATIFNQYLAYKLYAMSVRKLTAKDKQGRELRAYGVSYYKGHTCPNGLIYRGSRRFEGGVGTSCYTDYSTSYGRKGVAQYIGGSFVKIASGKTFDVYKYTDGSKK